MKAVVVAAGQGTRMRPLTDTRPKPMLPVAGKPLLAHVLDACAAHVDGYVVVVGYEADDVRGHFGDEYAGLPVEYVTQDEQLGTAHAIDRARGHVEGRFLALNGDVVFDEGLVAALAGAPGTAMATMRVENPSNYGVVDVADGRVTGIVEKPVDPPSNLANLGLYAFEQSVFDAIDRTERSERGEYEITDSIRHLVDDGRYVGVVEHEGEWLDVGRPWELLEANAHLLADVDTRLDGVVEEGVHVQGPVVVEEGARLKSGAYVEGPVVVKAGADVGPNAYVRGSTVVGEDAHVGNGVEIKNSILLPGATVGHLSYVGDSVLGKDVNFGAGTTVANLRHDGGNVRMQVKGEMVDTGRRKLGVVLGDRVKTGINTSLNAGVRLSTAERTGLAEVVTRDRGFEE